MIWGWENEKERILRFMRIPPRKKLEWLQQMNELTALLSRRRKKIHRKLRELR